MKAGGRGSRQQMRGRGGVIRRETKIIETPLMELTNPLSSLQKQYFISHFPSNIVKLSYETVAPKKVSNPEYDLCLAIPYGKRAYIWYTFYQHHHVCLLMELNRDNQLGDHITMLPYTFPDFELGTVVSGTIYERELEDPVKNLDKVFIIDDFYLYKGIILSKMVFQEKLGFLYDFLLHSSKETTPLAIRLPVLWNSTLETPTNIPYNIRHTQYRATARIMPHLNVTNNRKPLFNPTVTVMPIVSIPDFKFDYRKPIYKKSAVFFVRADIAYDVYYLGALYQRRCELGRASGAPDSNLTGNLVEESNGVPFELFNGINQKGMPIYFQNALVLNFKTSILLNSIFRRIRENNCLDAIEESDDEEDFEDIREDKYVDLNKEILMECSFHYKFKKWVPIRIVSDVNPALLDYLL